MEEIALCGASEVAKCLVVPIGRHCGYVMSSDRYVRQLNDEVKNLGDSRDEVQHSIDEARNNMKPIKPRVERWVNDVETVANEARDVLDYDGRAKKTCFYGWLPNPKARYHLGKKASRTVKDIQALMAGGQFEKVDFENPPPGLVGAALDVNSLAGDGGDFITDSRASIFQGIMKALNDEKVKVVGVYGPGGVGKTTLLEIIEKKLRKEGRPFHMIVKSKVSQTPDLTKIQFDIAYALGLKDLKDEPSEEGRRDLLFQRLQRDPSEKVLIILDDLWGELDLKAVGIPSADESRNCKLLLTSRDKSVLEQKLHAEQTFRLEGLSDKEARMLFAKIVRDKLKDNEELILKAVEVVMKLAGLPLLITSVASTLRCSDVSTWDNMIIKIEDPNIERIVKWSYDRLESEDAKCLFKLCGLIGGTIQVECLLGIGMGLGLFEGFNNTVQDSRNRLNKLLDKLHSTCLLLDGGDDKENVTIYDLYSEVVVSTTFSGQRSLMMNSNYGSWPKEKLETIRQVDVGRDKLAELMRCVFPELKILMLSQPENWKGRPAHRHDQEDCCRLDFTYMKELRVLYLRTMHITTLPSSMEILGNLCSLYLDHCKVGDVANLGKLKALQILSFVGSKISRLPKDIGELTNLRSLNLSDCYSLKVIEPGALKGLINLEELHMKGSFDQWMGKDEIPSKLCNAGLAELKSLRKIASLEISIRDPTILEDVDLPFGNLSKFWIEIGIVCITYDLKGNVVGKEFEGSRTMKLNLEGCDSILSEKWIQQILQKTQYLYLCELSGFKKSAHELCTQGFREVKYLKIEDSPSIKYIANSFHGLPLTAFKKLESLFLENLINLEKIYHGPIEPECFSKLKVVSVKHCDRLKYLWYLSDIRRLVQLEEIEVCKCNSLQSIVTHDAGEDIVSTNNNVDLPNVHRLILQELPNMTSFCSKAERTLEDSPIQISLPSLEKLKLYSVGSFNKLANFTLKQDAQLEGISIFQNLEKLYVYDMGLSFLFSVSVAKCLREIRDITVKDCPNMKAVIVDEEGRDEGTVDIIEFPLLNRLTISCCPIEKFFSYPHGKKESITTTSDSQDTYSNSFFDQKVSLPSLEHVDLCSVGSFKRIWHDELPKSSFCELGTLTLENCFGLLIVFPSTIIGRLHNLKEVKVSNLKCLESLFDCGSLGSNMERELVSLPKLERVEVRGARRLKHMVKSDSHMVLGFPSLTKVEVKNCSELTYLFPNYTATTLGKLEGLQISECERMKEVVPKEEGGQSKAEVISFPCLSRLSLEKLDNLICFSSGCCSYDFASLRSLRIRGCCNFGAFIPSPTSVERPLSKIAGEDDELPQILFNEMVTFPNIRSLEIEGPQCKELWNNQIPTDSFGKLKYLDLECCDNLQHIAPSHMWKRLQHCLKNLKVISCCSIEIIYEGDGMDIEGGELRSLVLRDLKNLRHIWQSNDLPNLPFPNLRDIETVRCPRLEMVFTTFTVKFLRQIKELMVESCEDMKQIAGHEKAEEATGTTVTFSELTILGLLELPKFKSFLPERYSLKFPCPENCPSLQDLSIVSCGAEPDQALGDWEGHQQARQLLMFFRQLICKIDSADF
ncbi:hypothetical protein EUGRSUZ_G00514 [Eucalyptus grandis]|uniref:AAA+ ATPase domain-containing protein n=2 Tax=Eucalyptus grandis TaxID=71139 RepID=A0A059BA13_EUCGR|nr:hypothetical protein EUGRSUZ_G00514 [Eucalyptus grandis]